MREGRGSGGKVVVAAAIGTDALGTGRGLRLSALEGLVGGLQGVRELGQRLVDPTVVLTVLLTTWATAAAP